MAKDKENLYELEVALCSLVGIAEDAVGKEEFEKLDNAGAEIIECLAELKECRAIGTIEEFKVLKEKAEPKKIIAKKKTQSYLGTDYYCPTCHKRQLTAYIKVKGDDYCKDCGQHFDWSE